MEEREVKRIIREYDMEKADAKAAREYRMFMNRIQNNERDDKTERTILGYIFLFWGLLGLGMVIVSSTIRSMGTFPFVLLMLGVTSLWFAFDMLTDYPDNRF